MLNVVQEHRLAAQEAMRHAESLRARAREQQEMSRRMAEIQEREARYVSGCILMCCVWGVGVY